jgi:predicted membrane channel-forming protein YqfA (hemolysin III family)
MSPRVCLSSLWYRHNQFANVWIMLATMPISLGLGWWAWGRLAPTKCAAMVLAWWIHAPVSAAYHLLQEVSEVWWARLKRWDYTMIFPQAVLLAYAMDGPVRLVVVCSIVNLGLAFHPQLFHGRVPRLVCTGVVVAGYLWPAVLDAGTNAWASSIVVVALLTGTVWASRVPERCWPGRFDLGMHSHACMHLCIAVGHLLEWGYVVSKIVPQNQA